MPPPIALVMTCGLWPLCPVRGPSQQSIQQPKEEVSNKVTHAGVGGLFCPYPLATRALAAKKGFLKVYNTTPIDPWKRRQSLTAREDLFQKTLQSAPARDLL